MKNVFLTYLWFEKFFKVFQRLYKSPVAPRSGQAFQKLLTQNFCGDLGLVAPRSGQTFQKLLTQNFSGRTGKKKKNWASLYYGRTWSLKSKEDFGPSTLRKFLTSALGKFLTSTLINILPSENLEKFRPLETQKKSGLWRLRKSQASGDLTKVRPLETQQKSGLWRLMNILSSKDLEKKKKFWAINTCKQFDRLYTWNNSASISTTFGVGTQKNSLIL